MMLFDLLNIHPHSPTLNAILTRHSRIKEWELVTDISQWKVYFDTCKEELHSQCKLYS